MSKKELRIMVALFIVVLVVLTYSLTGFENFMSYLNYRPEVAFIFWFAFIFLGWDLSQLFFKTFIQYMNKSSK